MNSREQHILKKLETQEDFLTAEEQRTLLYTIFARWARQGDSYNLIKYLEYVPPNYEIKYLAQESAKYAHKGLTYHLIEMGIKNGEDFIASSAMYHACEFGKVPEAYAFSSELHQHYFGQSTNVVTIQEVFG